MTRTPLLIIGLITLATPWAGAQPMDERLRNNLFPPDLVMQNQQLLGLTEEQKIYLKAEITQTQTRFAELQWKLESEMEKLAALAAQPKANEAQVLAQLDKVLDFEREIKRVQMILIIRIKNKLTAEQQARLRELRSRPAGK